MPVRDQTVDLVRVVEGVRGRVPMVMDFVVRFDYGSVVPWVYSTGDIIRFIAGPNGLCLTTPVHVEGQDFRHRAEFTVEAGDRVPFVLAGYASYKEPPPRIDPHDAVARTTTFWQEWTAQSTYDGDWRDLVQRSLITLEGAHLRAERRDRRRPDDLACPNGSAASATGTTATAGCATRRSRSTR